ncbi:hypothetical protein GGF31_006801 [Allomyces arbusculus]|nr:hypothetical protein GGF31_006801 [Allomyces arbusculus]
MFLSTRQYQEMTLADIQSMQNATNRLLFIYQRIITAFPAAPALYLLRFQTAFNRTNPIVTANTPIALVSTQYGLLLRVDRSNPGAWTVRADGTTIYGNMRFTMSPAIGGAANLTDGIKYGAAIFIKLKDTCMRLSKRDVGAENVQVSGNESWREQFKVEPAFSGAVNDGYVRVGDTVRLRCEFKSQGESASRWIRARAKTDGTVDALFDFDVLGSTWTIVGESGQFALPF